MITTTYKEIEIEYLEFTNQWRFELYGKEKIIDSLKEAKVLIDKPAPKIKFKKQKAWQWLGQGVLSKKSISEVTITSVIPPSKYHESGEAWIVDEKNRQKIDIDQLYADIPHNHLVINKILAIDAQLNELTNELYNLRKDLMYLKLPDKIFEEKDGNES